MPRLPLVVLHGWSDNSTSFVPIKNWLVTQGFNPIDVSLADYLSMNDEITLTDLGYAFQKALRIKGIPVTPHSFDIIVHSTGGLVVREYLRQVCGAAGPKVSPIKHACMLAPANFGSSWATLGKSVIGRLKKGWDWNHLFQSGQRILDALELASPYSWELAENDLFNPNFALFRPDTLLTTVLVGTIAYPGMESVVHEDGSDGTVRVSTANLNAHFIKADFVTAPQIVPRNVSRIALAVFHRNHGNIIDPNEPAQTDIWKKTLLDALTIEPVDYPQHLLRCDAITSQTFAEGLKGDHPEWYHQYQHVVFRVRDQFGDPVNDYMVEFYQELGDPNDEVFQKFHKDVLEKVTTNTKAPNFRSFMIDTNELGTFLITHPQTKIEVSISAANISDLIKYQNPPSGSPVFSNEDKSYILPNEPLLIDVVLPRDPAPEVFRL
jgi:hypothetical protein